MFTECEIKQGYDKLPNISTFLYRIIVSIIVKTSRLFLNLLSLMNSIYSRVNLSLIEPLYRYKESIQTSLCALVYEREVSF